MMNIIHAVRNISSRSFQSFQITHACYSTSLTENFHLLFDNDSAVRILNNLIRKCITFINKLWFVIHTRKGQVVYFCFVLFHFALIPRSHLLTGEYMYLKVWKELKSLILLGTYYETLVTADNMYEIQS